MDLMFDVEDATATVMSETFVQTLQVILQRPFEEHGAAAALPGGIVRVAHVFGLVRLLSTQPHGGNWRRSFGAPSSVNRGAALHLWLYHLGGGASEKLRPPAGLRQTDHSRDMLRMLETEEKS